MHIAGSGAPRARAVRTLMARQGPESVDPAGGVISSLASLPEFLRRPILSKRMREFYSLPDSERDELVRNALQAGPQIPFHTFEKLFGTWLDVLSGFTARERTEIFSRYLAQAARDPACVARFHLDGLLGSLLSMDPEKRARLCGALREAFEGLGERERKTVEALVPDSARPVIWA